MLKMLFKSRPSLNLKESLCLNCQNKFRCSVIRFHQKTMESGFLNDVSCLRDTCIITPQVITFWPPLTGVHYQGNYTKIRFL